MLFPQDDSSDRIKCSHHFEIWQCSSILQSNLPTLAPKQFPPMLATFIHQSSNNARSLLPFHATCFGRYRHLTFIACVSAHLHSHYPPPPPPPRLLGAGLPILHPSTKIRTTTAVCHVHTELSSVPAKAIMMYRRVLGQPVTQQQQGRTCLATAMNTLDSVMSHPASTPHSRVEHITRERTRCHCCTAVSILLVLLVEATRHKSNADPVAWDRHVPGKPVEYTKHALFPKASCDTLPWVLTV